MKGYRVCIVCGHKKDALSFAHPFVHCGEPMAYYTIYEPEQTLEPIENVDDAINTLEAILTTDGLGRSRRACVQIVIDWLKKKEESNATQESTDKL